MSTTVTEPGKAVCQRLTICNKRGLHARASARFVRTADHFDAQVDEDQDGGSGA